MQAAAERLRTAGVRAVYLVHGTFFGSDCTGLWGELSHLLPGLAQRLQAWQKRLIDAALRETGNYSQRYAALLASALNPPGAEPIEIRRFVWGSENHHLARAHAAVRLLDALAARLDPPGSRVLLWGHSHGGNVFALLTNLLGGDPEAVEEFFAAARTYYDRPGRSGELAVWARVRERLHRQPKPLGLTAVDVVTFGTPVRYGWESRGYNRLLHLINHCPSPGLDPQRAPFPVPWGRMDRATAGDSVQQLGIAGTNIAPTPLVWRIREADRALDELLEPKLGLENLAERLRLGRRVHHEGETLLVDYGPGSTGWFRNQAGHGVYTRLGWMLYHVEEVAARFYGAGAQTSREISRRLPAA